MARTRKEAEELEEALGHWGSPEHTKAPNTFLAHSPSKSVDYKGLVKAGSAKPWVRSSSALLFPSPSSLGRSLQMWLEEANKPCHLHRGLNPRWGRCQLRLHREAD